jgi:UDP-glucuronate decarboxylase
MHPNDGRVVSNFVVHALEGRPTTIYGEGDQTRSFCYVDDTVDALVRLMDTPEEVTGPVNIGNPVEITVEELAIKVAERTGASLVLEHRELPADDPRQRRPDISRARALLNWEPKVSLEDGLDRTVAYFRDLLAADDVEDSGIVFEAAANSSFPT